MMKWENITVKEMLHLYRVMHWISIEPWHLGVYNSYFESISIFICVQGYTVIIVDYGVRTGKITNLFHFRQLRSAYHPEFGESASGDKCH